MSFILNIPFNWLERLTHKNNKPNYLAILLLSYLNSKEIGSQKYINGQLNPYYDKEGIYFKRETLAKIFNCTKRNISLQLKYLEDKKLIKRVVERETNLIKKNQIEKLKKELKKKTISQSTYKNRKAKINKSQNTIHSKLYIFLNKEEIKKLNS